MTRPVILIIMDGVGKGDGGPGDAVALADMPELRALIDNNPHTLLKAHGTAVGLPTDDDIGNSEVGHNTMGCGQIYSQGASLINESISSGRLWEGPVWKQLVGNCLRKDSAMHFVGLLSDGNVHSNIAHLFAMLEHCVSQGVRRTRVHILLDGRDVPPFSAPEYVQRLETKLDECRAAGFDYRISTGGGRMVITMDRYEADWGMVALGWRTHVLGEGRRFSSAAQAIETYRREIPGVTDQYLPPFVVGEAGSPGEKMAEDDSVILFNFRGDRAIELSLAFDDEAFDKFDRGPEYPRMYAGILEYDSDKHVPKRYLLEPPQIKNTLTDLLNEAGVAQYAVSETQKFGHATYFWNGNRSGKQREDLEAFCEIPSDNISFDKAPGMKSEKIATALIEALETGRYGFLRCNFPNGDMVGHTGNIPATVEGLEALDAAIRRIREAAKKANAILIVTADHGKADDMLTVSKDGTIAERTAHSVNPVPFVIWDPENAWRIKQGQHTLANIAPTIARLLGLTPYDSWEESLLE